MNEETKKAISQSMKKAYAQKRRKAHTGAANRSRKKKVVVDGIVYESVKDFLAKTKTPRSVFYRKITRINI